MYFLYNYIHKFFVVFSLSFLILFSFVPESAIALGSGTLSFSPSSINVHAGNTFSLAVKLNTTDIAANAAEGSIFFDSTKLQVTSISKSGSIFTLWVNEPNFSNSDGVINFSGGLPNPGFYGTNGLILTINFRAKSTAVNNNSDIYFINAEILANDGKGTNILSNLGISKAAINISNSIGLPSAEKLSDEKLSEQKSTSEVNEELTSNRLERPIISSTTHPDQNKWYSDNNPIFKWQLPRSIDEILLILDKTAGSIPKVSYKPPINQKQINDVDDGIWYFIAQFKKGGDRSQPVNYRFQIDTKPPLPFDIIKINTDDSTNPTPQLSFDTDDTLSGIARYTVQINDEFPINVDPLALLLNGFTLPSQEPGIKNIIIRAYDKAGNYVEAKEKLTIKSIKVPILERAVIAPDKSGDILVMGHAQPNQKIMILIHSDEQFIIKTITDADGNFVARITGNLSSGKHVVSIKAIDERGAISLPSNEISVITNRVNISTFITNLFKDGFSSLLPDANKSKFATFFIVLILLVAYYLQTLFLRFYANPLLFLKKISNKIKNLGDKLVFDMKIVDKLPQEVGESLELESKEEYLGNFITKLLKALKILK